MAERKALFYGVEPHPGIAEHREQETVPPAASGALQPDVTIPE